MASAEGSEGFLFTCGWCHRSFHDADDCVNHSRICQANDVPPSPQSVVTGTQIEDLQDQSQQSASERERLWQPVIILEFIRLVQTHFSQLQDKITKKKKVWESIANAISRKVTITGNQCNTKWKNLMRSYKKFVDNTKRTGAAPIPKPAYFDEIHDLLHESHAINPVNLYDSGRKNTSQQTLIPPHREADAQAPTLGTQNVDDAENDDLPGLPEGVPGPSHAVPVGENLPTRTPSPLETPIRTPLPRETPLLTPTSRETPREPAGRRRRVDAGLRVTPMSHNSQMRALMERCVSVMEQEQKLLKGREIRKQRFRAGVLAELKRHNDIMERSEKSSKDRRKDSRKRRRDSSDES